MHKSLSKLYWMLYLCAILICSTGYPNETIAYCCNYLKFVYVLDYLQKTTAIVLYVNSTVTNRAYKCYVHNGHYLAMQ